MLAPIDLRMLAVTRLPKRGLGAEVGVHEGAFSRAILKHARPRKLFLIDPWAYEPDSKYDGSTFGGVGVDQTILDRRYIAVTRKFEAETSSGRVSILRERSSSAVQQFEDGSLDFVFLDADHTYEAVAEDLLLYTPKLKSGGIFVGNDYQLDRWWGDGVVRAFHEHLARENGLIIDFKLGNQIGIRKL